MVLLYSLRFKRYNVTRPGSRTSFAQASGAFGSFGSLGSFGRFGFLGRFGSFGSKLALGSPIFAVQPEASAASAAIESAKSKRDRASSFILFDRTPDLSHLTRRLNVLVNSCSEDSSPGLESPAAARDRSTPLALSARRAR